MLGDMDANGTEIGIDRGLKKPRKAFEYEWKDMYKAARQELKRAEVLLKERSVNVKQLLSKHNAVKKTLEKEQEKRKEAEKKARQENALKKGLEKRLEVLEVKVARLEELISNKDRPRNQNADFKGVITRNNMENKSSRETKRGRGCDGLDKTGIVQGAVDASNAAAVKKRILPPIQRRSNTENTKKNDTEKHKNGVDECRKTSSTLDTNLAVSSCLQEIFASNRDTDGHRGSKEIRVQAAVQTMVGLCKQADDTSLQFLASRMMKKMLECCQHSYSNQLAPDSWSPGGWFEGARDSSTSKVAFSLICMWCNHDAVEEKVIPWILYIINSIDREMNSDKLRKVVASISFDIVCKALQSKKEHKVFSLSELCCASTVCMCLFRSLGDIDAAASFIISILDMPDHDGNAMGNPMGPTESIKNDCIQLIPIAVALEVWPNALHNGMGPQFSIYMKAICASWMNDTTRSALYSSCCRYAATLILPLL